MAGNPLLLKELRQRMRTRRAPWLVTAYLLAMAALTFGLLYESMQGQLLMLQPMRGEQVFVILSMLQLTVVLFLTPAFAAGAVSGERERQTLPVLLTTPLRVVDLLVGKVLSCSALLILLMVVAMPLYSVVFLFGGAVPQEALSMFVFQVFNVIWVAAVSVMWSALTLRSGWSTVLSYATVAWLLVITGVVGMGLQWFGQHYPIDWFAERWSDVLLHLNPLWVMATLENVVRTSSPVPPWLTYCAVYMVLLIVLSAAAAWRLRPGPGWRRRVRWARHTDIG
ncbi:MAG: ABC transporter permease subunit [Thermoflavifilum sp.]|nr:ABC transporter permease subunit [Thermoflavifilum sp.]MCL6512893.1 ABC transporter permease [Alicyclobacillus sp.]